MQWYFGPFRLDEPNACLWRGEQRLTLRPKTFDLLRYLVAHADELVTKKALLEAVWPDTVVADGVLTTSMGELRKVLGETAREPRYIATVHRRGYRFIAPISPADQPPVFVPSDAPPAPGVLAIPRDVDESPHLAAPLVDREAELAQCHQWLEAAKTGRRQIVFVTGEAGIGKTTLIDAFLAQLAPPERPWIGRGQCIDHFGAGEAYFPLLEALGGLAGGDDGEPVRAILSQYAPSWLLQLPALVSPQEFPLLQQRATGTSRERMLRELAEAVEILTMTRPLIVVLEDLHWSDVSTLDWLAYIGRRRANARLVVLGTYRIVDALVRDHPVRTVMQELQVHGQCQELVLSYLSEAGVATYLAQRLNTDGLAPDFVRTLFRRTSGNPLFLGTVIDEIVRQRPQSEDVPGENGFAKHSETMLMAMPESLRLLLDQQLAQLRLDERACLDAASVAGREFSAAAVAVGLDAVVEEVEALCEVFARRGQFLHRCGTDVWPDGTVAARYGFRHDLYHELLYDQLPVSRRARWHQQIGTRLEVAYGDGAREIAAELAQHFVRGRESAQAVRYLQYAGENALRRSAPREAIQHLSAALEFLEQLPETPERVQHELRLQLTLASALVSTKGFASPELQQTYERAEALCGQLEDTPQRFAALYGLYVVHVSRADFENSTAVGQQALHLAERYNDRTLLIGAHEMRSCTLFHLGQFVQAQEHIDAGMALYEPTTHNTLVTLYGADLGILCRCWSALTLSMLGYLDQGLQRSEESLAMARAREHPLTVAYALLFASHIHCLRREVQRVRERTEMLIALATDHGFVDCLSQGTILHGWVEVLQGQGQNGLDAIQHGLSGYGASGQKVDRPYYLALLAEAYGQQGQAAAGLEVVAEALEMIGNHHSYAFEAGLHMLQGHLLQQAKRNTRTRVSVTPEECFQRARTIAQNQHAKILELRAAMSLGRLWLQLGKREAAAKMLAPLYDWFAEGHDTADLQEARVLHQRLQP